MKLNLTASNKQEELVLAYLQENASETLAEKINNGVYIEKDGKRLLNKKDLKGFMRFACEQARELAEKGANSACVEDAVVYGWAIHYFEEDNIEGTLYNDDGTEYKKVVAKPTGKSTITTKPVITQKKAANGQVSIFDMNFDEQEQDEPKDEADKIGTSPSGTVQATTIDTPTPKTTGQLTTEQTPQKADQAELFYYKYELIQKQYPDHILFYRLGDFYEAFGKSAELASDYLNLTLTGKNCGSVGRVPMCGIPYHAVDVYVDKLRSKYGVVLMNSDTDLKEYPKKDFADIVQENAEKLDAMDDELGLVIDEETDKEIDELPTTEYTKYFNNVDDITNKETGEITLPKIDKDLFDILYKLFDGQIVMG